MAEKHDELEILRGRPVPEAAPASRERAVRAALDAFDENSVPPAQASAKLRRLMGPMVTSWRGLMERKLIAAPALAALVGLPLAGYMALDLAGRMRGAPERPVLAEPAPPALDQAYSPKEQPPAALPALARQRVAEREAMPAMAPAAPASMLDEAHVFSPPAAVESGDRIESFSSNPLRAAAQEPISTFSLDVDTASYSFTRRALEEGVLPQPDTVRVEELINYFPYDWPKPADRSTPFATAVTVMPTPWNAGTKLMHVAIKGFEMERAARPRANLVFLIDVSGSMDAPDKLPLLRSAFRLLVDGLSADDTVSIVTYAGEAGTVLEPTSGAEKDKILAAIDRLAPGGSTAGAAGIEEAYRLAQRSFVEGGVNRVMLATDGDFNVGQSDDASLKAMIEERRKKGIYLSVLGFGRGNLNDRMMQTLAQNGNGNASYIDTLSEARKVLADEVSATLFPIAKDVKVQVEFNPAVISEYRLIGYETRALKREDFNNDRVDAGEVGAGASVTAIYEITPKGSLAEALDPLRYGQGGAADPSPAAHGDEYAFVKVRYKPVAEDASKLITTSVGRGNEASSFEAAGTDQRFSVAVAAFGQKLRREDATAGMRWEDIEAIAGAARDADPFGYRAEFLSLVRLASALDREGPGRP